MRFSKMSISRAGQGERLNMIGLSPKVGPTGKKVASVILDMPAIPFNANKAGALTAKNTINS